MLVLKDRILTEDGLSVVSFKEAAKRIALNGELPSHVRVFTDSTAEYQSLVDYELFVGRDIFISDNDVVSRSGQLRTMTVDRNHTETEYLRLCDIILASHRLDTDNPVHMDRIDKELDFFRKNNHIKLLLSLVDMINKFKCDGVVWGVGRGSSCASFILYLLEVHDVNSIRYDIPFKELSKEKE